MLDGPAHSLGPALRRWRALRRIKQAHAAEWFGVTQSTVSRWDRGSIVPEPDERRRTARLIAPLSVRRGLRRWTRFTLSDGTAVRPVETLQ